MLNFAPPQIFFFMKSHYKTLKFIKDEKIHDIVAKKRNRKWKHEKGKVRRKEVVGWMEIKIMGRPCIQHPSPPLKVRPVFTTKRSSLLLIFGNSTHCPILLAPPTVVYKNGRLPTITNLVSSTDPAPWTLHPGQS